MKCLLTAALLLFFVSGYSQKVVDVSKEEAIGTNTFYSVGGQPFVNAKFVRLKSGSPYFIDEWMKGRGIAESGHAYSSGLVKLNLLDNQILFMNSKGIELVSIIPVKELVLTDSISGLKFRFVSSITLPASASLKKGWYLQLASGKAGLYQFFNKWMVEDKPYGSATTELSIVTKEEFFVAVNGALVQVKKTKDLTAVLADKKKEIEGYLINNNLQDKTTAEQFTALINYYNTLQ